VTALDALQSYVDERARRHAVAGERSTTAPERELARARMRECLEIGQYIARQRAAMRQGETT